MTGRQFGVHRLRGGRLVVVVQADLLLALGARVVVPLVAEGPANLLVPRPAIEVQGRRLFLMPQMATAVRLTELGPELESIEADRDAIIAAMDLLLTGI